jgi:serine/threonine-protein kinase
MAESQAPQPTAQTALAQRHFGPYELLRSLGEGAFGTVYEAIKLPLGKRVAIKILHAQWADNARVTERFIQEARAAASLRHPHIVDVDDIGAKDGVPWIAMEFLDGESLASRLASVGRFSLTETLEIMLPILSAVAAIHDKGIIHRDLKPDNIQLWQNSTGTTHPKLLDFGIAKMKADTSSHALTGATEIMGTPEYMAPEQWRSAKTVEPASDQWALAVIIYRLFTGISPFAADSPQSIMFRASMEAVPRFAPELAEYQEFEAALSVAFNKDPALRYESVRAFAKALVGFADAATQQRWRTEFGVGSWTGKHPAVTSTVPIAPSQPNAPADTQKPGTISPENGEMSHSLIATSQQIMGRSRSRPLLYALGGFVLLLGSIGTYALTRSHNTHPTDSMTVHPIEAPHRNVQSAGLTPNQPSVAVTQATIADAATSSTASVPAATSTVQSTNTAVAPPQQRPNSASRSNPPSRPSTRPTRPATGAAVPMTTPNI